MSSTPALQPRIPFPETSRFHHLPSVWSVPPLHDAPPTSQASATFIWEAFIALNDLDRHLWLNYIWCRRCRCSLAIETGLTDEQVRARLVVTARYLDEILHWRGLGGLPPLRQVGSASVSLIGPSRRRLDAQMRRRESCSCKLNQSKVMIQGMSASWA